ncbi:MAG TPA: hypothetical protein VGN39_09765 [Terriglobales bacterium]|nr:hypothetical protein [Terriglobales bacterium]
MRSVKSLYGLRGLAALSQAFLILIFVQSVAHAATASFDLIGPKVEVRVQRAGQTLPISQVPDLQSGDRLWVHADLPDTQSVHYLMVIAFLRGATNPPPDSWFIRVETWSKPVHEEGVFVTVPETAEEALVFLAPDTGGAFSTLRSTVRGKPGAFVRAAQDLEQVSFERLRLEKYLEAVRETSNSDPGQLKSRTTLLARSLNIRLDQQCFDKPSAQQAPCLTQNTDQMVLDDTQSQTMVASLTTGAPTDLLAQLSSTPTAHSGYYSPYIGAVVDVVRILSTAHTARYQYIPTLALPKENELNLRLNNPPSFRDPKSVLVIGLPPILSSPVPPLRAVDATHIFCVDQPALVLPVEGAPLVFATDMAHNFILHVETKSGPGIDLPAKADSELGGFVVDTQAMETPAMRLLKQDGELSGILRGMWGFRQFNGPRFRLQASRPGQWIVGSKDASALIVGREDTLHLESPRACCVSEVTMKNEKGSSLRTEWEIPKPGELDVKVPLQNASAGRVTILIKQFGQAEPDEIPLHTYAEAARLDAFTIHAGDDHAVLKGTRLDQVTAVEVNGVRFTAGSLTRANQQDELSVMSHDPSAKILRASTEMVAGDPIVAHVTLEDGRVFDLKSSVQASRPVLTLLTKNVELDQTSDPIIRLGNQDELPQDARLNFFLKAQVPETFSATERIEVQTADGSFRVLLGVKNGNLTLQDSKTVFAVLDPMKLLGPSAFGPLEFRPVTSDGIEGDWQPLINVVRVPLLKEIRCAPAPEKQCVLAGDKLFLIDAVSADPDFSNAITVPDGFVQDTLTIPPPKGKTLYIKLRDDPAGIDTANVAALTTRQ